MDLWIQPCAESADFYGQAAAELPHHGLILNGVGAANYARIEEHYTCARCQVAFAAELEQFLGAPGNQLEAERLPARSEVSELKGTLRQPDIR
ncbi:conserved hypothetical protein [Paraburkholderia ribeironis]|uniref:Uncharacterized protein n=1 Tax=Paraburkholderia ribeironis TaxID=1247936 RepID=A0A1N7S719_9BURK|nr:conserved hypothetical protein [Paraburkholderia ribeironis]